MKITNQINTKECGICVLTSLHNHYYPHQQIEKDKLLDNSFQNENGMSVFDFETSATSLGLDAESYELKWNEFLDLKIKQFFVLLLKTTNDSNHYVIARKKKKCIEIYDSASLDVKTYKYSELLPMFLGVLILINKKPNKVFSKTFGQTKTMLMFDAKFIVINLLLSILLLAISIASASFLNWIIDLCISKSSINNLLLIGFIFIIVFISNDILTYVTSLYSSHHLKTYYQLLQNKILSSLETKRNSFLWKVDKQWIYKIDECVYSISNYCVVAINKFITSIILTLVSSIILGCLNVWLLVFVSLLTIIELIFFLFSYNKKRDLFSTITRQENKNSILFHELINSIKNEIWYSKRSKTIFSIKENYGCLYKNYSDAIIFKNNTNLFKSIIRSFLEVCLVVTMSYFIIKNMNFSIGNLTFALFTNQLLKNSLGNIFDHFLIKIEFDLYWQVYKDLTNVDNVKPCSNIDVKEIKEVELNMNNKTYVLETKKAINITDHTIHKLLSYNMLNSNVILVDQRTKADKQSLIQSLGNNPNLYVNYIKQFKLNLDDSTMTFYDSLIVNLLNLLEEENKIIFIDDVLQFINPLHEQTIKEILNKVRYKNALFITGRYQYDQK